MTMLEEAATLILLGIVLSYGATRRTRRHMGATRIINTLRHLRRRSPN
jgi:hypothetical protein